MTEELLNVGLLTLLVSVTLMILRSQHSLSIVVLTGAYSLLMCSVFVVLDAVDVAFTESAVGAGVSTVLYLAVLAKVGDQKAAARWPSLKALMVGLSVVVMLVSATYNMPGFGDPSAPVHTHVAPHYLLQSGAEVGVPNVVTSVLASYRGYDTLGETCVVFAAGIAVIFLLSPLAGPEVKRDDELAKDPILKQVMLAIIPIVILFAFYVQFHGDYGPGGGFQAGVIFAAGVITFGLLRSPVAAKAILPQQVVFKLMALGVLTYLGTGLLAVLLGGAFLDYSALAASAHSGQHYGIFFIELGVGTTVATTMIALYYQFSSDEAL